ncbi:claspin isoform X3 [Pyrgilauda ruficollis]|uniref:claspin isoform X3 n=1 Tax=Pyrgilauda ruficollis TaxID=221976 RepID=UPI001B85BFBA|nr:claspin isoform X3 [Pyrgilauda ruficollis]
MQGGVVSGNPAQQGGEGRGSRRSSGQLLGDSGPGRGRSSARRLEAVPGRRERGRAMAAVPVTTEGSVELPLADLNPDLQKPLDSDSDSGQGSCETASPGPLGKSTASFEDRDSEEEIFVRKKAKNQKVLEDSESEEEEDGGSPVQENALGGDKENGEEKENIAAGKKKSHRVCPALLDSDDSDSGDPLQPENLDTGRTAGLPEGELEEERPLKSGRKYRKHKQKHDVEGEPAKEAVAKSRRRKEKEKIMESIKQLRKEKKPVAEVNGAERFPFNDSGCLLDDKDLFDNGLEEENDQPLEDEESLESIRAAVKNKIKKYKNKERFPDSEGYKHVFDEENEEPILKEPKRKERKAARLSKEAIKQLHSETQRLLRESSLSLPYHVPEAKSVHDFFKSRPRPACQGNAMALLKSSKYQLPLNEESAAVGSLSKDCKDGPVEGDQSAAAEPEMNLGRDVDDSVTEPLAAEGRNLAEDCAEQPRQDREDSHAVVGTVTDDNTEAQQLPSCLSTECDQQKESEIPAASGDALMERGETAPDVQGETNTQQVGPGLVAQPEKVRKSKLDKLRELGIDLSIQPRICSDNESFITLEEADSNKELEALKARFLKHTLQPAKSKGERAINMNIIRKETTSDGKEELRADVVPAVLAAESLEEAVHTKPGEKLQALKAKLQEAMKLRRSEERQKRQALFRLDNEEMLEEEEEEEEEEMTDESEEEEEEEEGDHENSEFLLDEAEEDNEDREEKHAEDGDKETDKESIDGEKLEKSERGDSVLKHPSTESTLMLFKDSSSKMGYSLPDEKLEMEETVDKGPNKLEDDDSFSLPALPKENSHNSSFEFIGSMIPSYQPCNKQASRGGSFFPAAGGFRSPSPGFFKTSFISSASKSSGKTSEPSLPIEDSQDLYNASPEPKSLFPGAGESRFQFSLEDDTQSQLLDADGFLNVGQHRNKYQSSKHQLPLASMDENAMDANMDELLDLCSGQFSSQAEHVANTSSTKKQNMEELLNLCSGKFVSQTGSPTWASSVSSKAEKYSDIEDPMAEALELCSGSFPTDREEEEEEEQEELGGFQLLTDDEAFASEEDEKEDEDSAAEEGERSDDEEEELLRHRPGSKKKLKLQDFMEEEAELSGSDVGSEDEYDGEDLNEYEEDIIDEELPDEAELGNQIQKFHMKAMLDDDKRRLRLYQERYLLDGDLHSDGPGRTRRFRWKNIDFASQMDLFQRDSDNEEENEEFEETEVKWRKERFEREQWLREQKEKNKEQEEEEEEIGGDSEFMKLAKKVTAKSLQKKASPAVVAQGTAVLPRNPFEAFRPASDIQIKNGSLLNRPKAVLQKLAAMSDLNPNAPRNSRNFVFHTLSPEKSEEAKEKSKPQVKKRGPSAVITPAAKRPRVESSEETSQSRSIFQYLES